MRDRLQAWSRTVLNKWKDLTRSQKLRVAGIAAAVLVALVLTLFLALRTNWQPAFTGVDPATAGQIESVLADANIPSRTDTTTGVVYVPAHQVDTAITTAHLSDVLWDRGYTFRDAMADMGMGTTHTQQHEALLRARESEIANLLMRTNFISTATVGLALPNVPSFLIQATTPATASINVSGTRTLTPEDGEVIALIVSRMVTGLDPENVAVIDDSLNILFSDGLPGHGGADMAGGMSLSMSFEFHVRQVLINAIMETFSPMFDDVNPAFALDFDWSIINSVAREYTSPLGEDTPDGLRAEHEIMHRVGETADGAPMGIPGLDTQGGMPGGDLFPGTAGPGTMFIEEREERVTHFQNFVETVRAWGHIPGRFFAPTSSVAITLTNHYVFYEEIERELGTLEELSWLEWQTDMGNGGIIIDPDFIEQFENHVAMATGIPSVSIIIQYRNHFIDEEITPLPIAEIILLSLVLIFVALLAFLMIRRTSPDIIEEIEPELSVEDMLVSSRLENERAAEIERLAEIQYNADSQVKEQIDKFALEMPESVAQLLRNWINEDWE